MRRVRVKSSLHHTRMVHLDFPWAVRITWNLHLSPPILLPLAPYFLMIKALCLPGPDHWLILQLATRSGNKSLAALQNSQQLPVLDDTPCHAYWKSSLQYPQKNTLQWFRRTGISDLESRATTMIFFSQIHSCTDFFPEHRSMYRLERELN